MTGPPQAVMKHCSVDAGKNDARKCREQRRDTQARGGGSTRTGCVVAAWHSSTTPGIQGSLGSACLRGD